MKIILKENIENLGKKGDIVEVAAGYGRNYLIPKNLALEVTPSNMKMIEMQQKALRKRLEKEIASSQKMIEQLNQVSLTFERKAGDKDVIFGSVSAGDIREALAGLGFEVEKKKIVLDEPIKRLGHYTVPVKIFHDQKAEIKVEVRKEGEPEETVEPVEEETPGATSSPEEPAEEEKEAPSEDPEEPPKEETKA